MHDVRHAFLTDEERKALLWGMMVPGRKTNHLQSAIRRTNVIIARELTRALARPSCTNESVRNGGR